MGDIFDTIFGADAYDPCAALKALRPIYMRLIAGVGEQEITFRERTTRFTRGSATDLAALIAQLERECAAKNGTEVPVRRRAIVAGGRYQ